MNHGVYNILICGTGGQGILKASEVIGRAAMKAGFHVKKSEVHGMAQRGGSVESHIRFGAQVHSPLIMPGTADYLVCFDRDEGERMRYYLKEGGIDFRSHLSQAGEHIPNPLFLNTYLTAILSAYLPIDERAWLAALDEVMTRKQAHNRAVFLEARAQAAGATTEGHSTDP